MTFSKQDVDSKRAYFKGQEVDGTYVEMMVPEQLFEAAKAS